MPARILVVENDSSFRENLCEAVGASGYEPIAVSSAEAALTELARERIDFIVIDHWLPGMTGASLLSSLRASGHQLPAVIVAAWISDDIADAARGTGVTEVMSTPLDIRRLLSFIEELLGRTGVRLSPT